MDQEKLIREPQVATYLWWVLRSHASCPGTWMEINLERQLLPGLERGMLTWFLCLVGHNALTVTISRVGPIQGSL